jgi:hypothetical protein
VAVLYRDGTIAPAEYVVAAIAAAGRFTPASDAWTIANTIAWGAERYRTRFRALWSPDALHVRFDAADDRPWHTMTRHDDHLWEEEVVEIFLDPARNGRDYAELEISPANVVCDVRLRRPWPDVLTDLSWHVDGLDTEVVRHAGGAWTAIARIPFAAFTSLSAEAAAVVPPSAGDRWRFNVFRIKRPGGPGDRERDAVYAAWSTPPGPSFHVPSVFRDFVFGR